MEGISCAVSNDKLLAFRQSTESTSLYNMYDFLIIGGGIVGLSTAWQLQQQRPDSSILLLEKESRVAAHQTGRNSGVLHAGIYYTPGSLKAQFCKEGVDATIQFCNEHDIPVEQCGKLVVATNDLEHERMLALYERAQENGLEVELLDGEELRLREPNIVGIGAIFVRTTGIADFPRISEQFAVNFEQLGGEVRLDSEVASIDETDAGISVSLTDGTTLQSQFLIACGGLMADRLAMMQGIDINFRIIPYRGEYFQLPATKNDIVKHLIYPIPDPDLPFLGVHLTRMIDGSVTVGPNAVQAWKREGYGRINLNLRDIASMFSFPGFWRVLWSNLGTGVRETWSSIFKRRYLRRVQVYCPSLSVKDLLPYRTGVRAMAVERDGTIVHDFLFAETKRSLHVCSAPSPAATSAIPIGRYICSKVVNTEETGV
jgi:L-2-hydroxyglutarate oxidase